MCIKVVRLYTCPVRTASLSTDTPADDKTFYENTQDTKHGSVIPKEFTSIKCSLPDYEGFTYVCHRFESWIRCAAWNNKRCTKPGTPFEERTMVFDRPCHSCSGYAHCLSERKDAIASMRRLRVPDEMSEETIETWRRRTAMKALECILETCTTNYNWLNTAFKPRLSRQWVPYEGFDDEALLPYIHSCLCVENQEHMLPHVDFSGRALQGLIYCYCPSSREFAGVHNPLRAMHRDAALHLANCFDGFDSGVGRLWEGGWFQRNQKRHSKIIRDFEFSGYSSYEEADVLGVRQCFQNALENTRMRMRPSSYELFCDESNNGADSTVRSPTGFSASAVFQRRSSFALHMAWLLTHDPGLPESAQEPLLHLLNLFLMPCCDGTTGVQSLDEAWNWARVEDLTMIKSFIKAVDELPAEHLQKIYNGHARENKFLFEAREHAKEVIENLKIVNEDFDPGVQNCLLPDHLAPPEDAEDCPICSEGWVAGNMPDHWRTVKMPCCGKHIHAGCVQGSVCKPREDDPAPTCPLCRADMRIKKYAWFQYPAQLGREVHLSKAVEGYEDPEAFFPHDMVWDDRMEVLNNQGSEYARSSVPEDGDEMEVDGEDSEEQEMREDEEMGDAEDMEDNEGTQQQQELDESQPRDSDSDFSPYDQTDLKE